MPQDGAQNQALDVVRQIFVMANQGRLSYGDLSTVAKVFIDAKNYGMAQHLYKTWISNTPSPMAYIVYADYGDALVGGGDIQGAREAYQRSLQLNGAFERARLALAKLLA